MTKPKAEGDRDDQIEERIEELKRRAEELAGGEMEMSEFDDCPAEIEEAFWESVVGYEEAPWTTNFEQLEKAGISLPAPDSLDDAALTAKLWEVIHALALLHVFVELTNHLSDRELYTHLWTESLREDTKLLPATSEMACHLPMLGDSEEDQQLYLKYYAEEDERQHWHAQFPDDFIPEHEDLPYDRDRLLPKRENYSSSNDVPY
jgi:hypothetical protein